MCAHPERGFQPPTVGLPEEAVAALNQTFLSEVRRYGLCYTCLTCVHRDTATDRCSMDFPNEILLVDDPPALLADGEPIFCKYYELV